MGKLSLGRPTCGHGHLIEAAACNRGLRSHSFLQLFGDFDYWLLNGGWRLNKWPLNAGSTVMVALSMCLLL